MGKEYYAEGSTSRPAASSEEITPYSKPPMPDSLREKIISGFPKRENPFKKKEDKDPPIKKAKSPDKMPKQQYT